MKYCKKNNNCNKYGFRIETLCNLCKVSLETNKKTFKKKTF